MLGKVGRKAFGKVTFDMTNDECRVILEPVSGAGGRKKTNFQEGFRPVTLSCCQELSETQLFHSPMSVSSGLLAGSSPQNGNTFKREFSGRSHKQRLVMSFPSEHSLSSGSMDQGSDASVKEHDEEDSESEAFHNFQYCQPSQPSQPSVTRKTKSLSWESSDCRSWGPRTTLEFRPDAEQLAFSSLSSTHPLFKKNF